METQLPTWLEQSPETLLTTTTHNPLALSFAHQAAEMALAHSTYEIIFEDTLEKLADAKILEDIVDDYNDSHSTNIKVGHFRKWILSDKARKSKWNAANELGSYAHLDKSFRIAAALDNPMEDVARSTLRVKQHMIAAKVYNRKVFGDDATLSGSTGGGGVTVNITGVTSPYSRPAAPTITPITPVIVDNNMTIDV
jgi:hypothetical protein